MNLSKLKELVDQKLLEMKEIKNHVAEIGAAKFLL